MKKRQHKKVMCLLVAKIIAQVKYPELELKASKVEYKLFKNEHAKVKHLVHISLKELETAS
jgi:hypothetical protein